MPLIDRLNHTLVVERPTLGEPNERGDRPRTYTAVATVRGAVHPKSSQEVANLSQAGAVASDQTIFLLFTDLTTEDRLHHPKAECPVPDAFDLPDVRYELAGIHNPAGKGHHLELDATLVQARGKE